MLTIRRFDFSNGKMKNKNFIVTFDEE